MTELEAMLLHEAFDALSPNKSGSSDEADRAAKVRERIGGYLKYQEQRKPVAYVAVGESDGILVALTEYAGGNESEVYSRVLRRAMNEGYRGTGVGRMAELGWTIKGLYFD